MANDLVRTVNTITVTNEANGRSSSYPIGAEASNIIMNDGSSVEEILNTGFVKSVNGEKGDITLEASDIGAIPARSGIDYSNGTPPLDITGKIPSAYLPGSLGYIIEVASFSKLPTKGDMYAIYLTLDNSKTYRWGGSQYVEIPSGLVLSTDSNPNTAYPSDRGKIGYDHAIAKGIASEGDEVGFYKFKTNAEGHITSISKVTTEDITDLVDIPSSFPTNIKDADEPSSDPPLYSIVENAIKTESGYSFEGSTVTVISNSAEGDFAHAEGLSYNNGATNYRTKANNVGAHAEGIATQALGMGSHSGGRNTVAAGKYSQAEGLNTSASGDCQTVIGKNNINDSSNTYAFIIGNGDSSASRSNALGIKWDGSIVVKDGNDNVELTPKNITNIKNMYINGPTKLTSAEINSLVDLLK